MQRLSAGILRMSALSTLAGFVVGHAANDLVAGNLIQFDDNGCWSWFQDERAIVDVAAGKLLVGGLANIAGSGGPPRDGDVGAELFDFSTGRSQMFVLKDALISYGAGDDHNTAAFLIRPDGRTLAMYAGHNTDFYSYYRIFDGNAWSAEQRYDWRTKPGGTDTTTTYSNLFYLSAENRTYNFARQNHKSPNSMISSDMGNTWIYGGQLTRNANVGYVNGYLKYWSNGVDRIDFTSTEYHPRDFNTSIYHGYIRNGQSFKSDGILVDANVLDTLNVPSPLDFTPIFAANTVVRGITMTRCWNLDVQRYADGSIAALIKARANDLETDHRFFYCRYNGSTWSYAYLGKAGAKLFASEQDYTGLGALVPHDPNTIYISTPIDPRDSTNLTVHEIFKGVTSNLGATWTWTPVTRNSTRDNIRPIVPAWSAGNTALMWIRGSMTSSHNYDEAVVGIVERSSETVGKMTYVDASASNTTLATGAVLNATGPSATAGAADNLWHWRTGFGNGGSVLASAESGGENAVALRTQATAAQAGTYDVWANFWADPTADWRIRAGLTAGGTQVFRQMASKQVENGDHATAITLTGTSNTFLYQAYLGRVQIAAGGTLDAYVDDEAIQIGTASTLIGNTARTWYDGISFAQVNGAVGVRLNRKTPGTGIAPRRYDLRGKRIKPSAPARANSGSGSRTFAAPAATPKPASP